MEAATLKVAAGTVALGVATSKLGVAVLATTATCIVAGVMGLGAFPPHRAAPQPVGNKITSEGTLLDFLRSPDFAGPSSIGKSNAPNNDGLFWADHSSKAPVQSRADLRSLLVNKSEQDLRVALIPAGRWIEVRFQRPMVDGPGADILLAGWTGPAPLLEVSETPGPGMPLRPSIQVVDTLGRTILGYDVAELPQAVPVTAMRVVGVHNQGPRHGFELHQIRARMTQRLENGQAP